MVLVVRRVLMVDVPTMYVTMVLRILLLVMSVLLAVVSTGMETLVNLVVMVDVTPVMQVLSLQLMDVFVIASVAPLLCVVI